MAVAISLRAWNKETRWEGFNDWAESWKLSHGCTQLFISSYLRLAINEGSAVAVRTQNWNLRLLEARGKFGTTNAYQNKSGRIRTGKYYLLCLTGVRGSQFSRDGTNWLYWHGHHVLVCWSKSCHSKLIWHRVYIFSTWYHAVSSCMQRLSTFNWYPNSTGMGSISIATW